jgi:hypothetical protein
VNSRSSRLLDTGNADGTLEGKLFEMIREHDRVVLTEPVPAEGLEAGDVGTVVHVYLDRKAFEIEFTTLDGKTAAVATVEAPAIRPVTSHEITHSRELRRAS